MKTIYEPKGKAREYSPYALNIYRGCDHDCKYCYIKTMTHSNNINPTPRVNIVSELEKYLKKHIINKQVLLSFTGDPYCKADTIYKTTRDILLILNEYDVPTAILTKGGKRLLRDLDIFKKFKNIKIGATLTLTNDNQSKFYEPGASLPEDRMEALKEINKEGIKTWISFEPVIDPEQTYELLNLTNNYINEYQVGKMNYYKTEKNINWGKFGDTIAKQLLSIGKEFYIKKDLYKYMTLKLENKYIEEDYLTLKNKIQNKQTYKLQPALF